MCSLSDIGLNDYLDPAYNTNSGECKKVRMDGQIV